MDWGNCGEEVSRAAPPPPPLQFSVEKIKLEKARKDILIHQKS